MNKWHEWDDFSHKDNPTAPRATYYPGVFQVYLERKMINSYNMYNEKRRVERSNASGSQRAMGSTHTSFVESETRQSVESQIQQFNRQRQSNRSSHLHGTGGGGQPSSRQSQSTTRGGGQGGGMFEADNEDEEDADPYFNAEEIAFKVRQ